MFRPFYHAVKLNVSILSDTGSLGVFDVLRLAFVSNLLYYPFFRYCRAGAGSEVTPNKCDTPGFVIRDSPAVVVDDRNYMKLEMPRKHVRMIQTPLKVLWGWHGNCDVKVLLYRSNSGDPDPSEIARVTDYIVSYACKGNEKLQVEKDIMKDMIER